MYGICARALGMAGDALLQRQEVQHKLAKVVRDYDTLGHMFSKLPKWDYRSTISNITTELRKTTSAL